MAIGSLPHDNVSDAMSVVKNNFGLLPFWPQLVKINRNEDMIVQFLEGLPGLAYNESGAYIDNESDIFFEQLEEFFIDYEEITSCKNSELLDKYAISEKNSSSFHPFLEIIKANKPTYAKGQIVGPFTLATTLTDNNGRNAYYDETLREIIIKLLSLKALWQIKEIKKINSDTTPIIFIDEPSISQLGTSAFITITKEEVTEIFKEVSDIIKNAGGLSAIHCCGKCDWTVPIESGVDIINFDGYFYAQNVSLFSEALIPFLQKGGILACGVVPTLDKEALESAKIDTIITKFEEAVSYLTEKGIDKELVINHCMVTPSCGAGSLSVELANKAMSLTKELSSKLKERF